MKLKILFYVTKSGSNINFLKEFIFYLLKEEKIELFIVCDSEEQYSDLQFISGVSRDEFHLVCVKKNSLIKKENIEELFFSNKIKAFLFFNGQMTVTRSSDLIEIYKTVKNTKIKFYWINRLFLKDRYCIYDDIFFNSKIIYKDYKNILENKFTTNHTIDIKKYIESYWQFKDNIHEKQFNNIQKFQKKSLIAILRNFSIFRPIVKTISQDQIKHLKPYILLLLPKDNHWFNEYANQEFLNFKKIIELTYTAAKKNNLNLVVKRHPRERNSSLSSEIGRKNIYTYKGDLSESAKNAELVVFTGTTSGLETLLLCKKVIQLGSHSALPVINNEGLTHIVSKMKDYLKIFDDVVRNHRFDERKLYALLDSVFENSYSLNSVNNGKSFKISSDRNINHMSGVAYNFVKRLEDDFFIK